MKKKVPHRKFIYVANEENNSLSCEKAVEIAKEYFGTNYCEEVEPGAWIFKRKAWALQPILRLSPGMMRIFVPDC